jgi:hypothetical protein
MEQDNLFHLARFKNTPPHPAYIAGLIDGDGCIFIRKINQGYQSGITITQCRTNVLQVIRYHFGGSITTSANRNNKAEDMLDETGEFYHKHNVRNQYNLMLRSNEYKLLLDYIRFTVIIKQPQIECLNEFYKLSDIPNIVEEKEVWYRKCSELNSQKKMDVETLSRMSIEYLQGLFDAEGCIYINKKKYNNYYISIAQKNHPVILEKIKEFLGYGIVDTYEYNIYKISDCLNFIRLMKDGLIVKYNQAVAFERFLLTDDIEIKQAMYKICNEEKHKIECFDEVNCNDIGKDGYDKTTKIKAMKEDVCREIRRKEVYREKSEKMMGEGNHNFGKPKSDETKKKMSTAIRNAKNGISDETILKVRELVSTGKPNYEIQELLGLSRDIVSRVKNGNIVCRTEALVIKKSSSKEEQNIKKRKITLEEMLIVIEKTVTGNKPLPILTLLDERRLSQNLKNDLTIDIIKNIKRALTQNKLPFYKNEVATEKYRHYEELVNVYYNGLNKV